MSKLVADCDSLKTDWPRCTEHLCHRDELLAEIDRLTRELREAQGDRDSWRRWAEHHGAEVSDLRAKLAAAEAALQGSEHRSVILFGYKNLWADRAREVEARLAELQRENERLRGLTG